LIPQHHAVRSALALAAALAAAACSPAAAEPAPPQDAAPAAKPHDDLRVGSRPWIDPDGTSIVGFGLLRLVPAAGRTSRFEIRYREKPGDYGGGVGEEYQLFLLPGDAFATKPRAYADEFLAFTRTHGSLGSGAYVLRTSVDVAAETTVLVGYGPWTAPDAGRPAGDRPVFRIDVTSEDGAHEWLESEAGELITTNWTNRPGVKRGGPYPRDNVWVEVRPMILYDGRSVRAADEAPDAAPRVVHVPVPGESAQDAREEDADAQASAARADRRIVMTRELAEKFRRVPIRWR
jgi:hypothetical protein